MNHDFHLLSITKDCISYTKRCQECQLFVPIEHIPSNKLNIMIKLVHEKKHKKLVILMKFNSTCWIIYFLVHVGLYW
jgi:hypothetical protein